MTGGVASDKTELQFPAKILTVYIKKNNILGNITIINEQIIHEDDVITFACANKLRDAF